MALWDRVYDDDQRAAVEHAYRPRVCSARRVAELAAQGNLQTPDGRQLEPFEIKDATIRSLRRDALRRERAAVARGPLADASPRDAIEVLRRGMIELAEQTMRELRRQKPADRDPERMRQLARAIREAAAIPGPGDPRPAAPGAKTNGARAGFGETRGGLAGQLLAAHRAGAPPAPAAPAPVEPPAPVPDVEPEDPRAVLGEQLSSMIAERLRDHLEPPTAPAGPPERPTFQSAPRPPEAVPPGTQRDRFRHDRLADEDLSSIPTADRRRA